jgi:PLD-like domain/WXXGXW repeat (2 copies)
MMGDAIPESELAPQELMKSVGNVDVRIVATLAATIGMFRFDQLVTALARKRLWLTDAYYGGVAAYVQGLRAAARDGVDVCLLVPNATDIPLLRPLSRAGYRPLLEAGVRVFEWNGRMVHAKTAVADGLWARIGSTNLNIASWMGNCELDVVIEDEHFARNMEEMYAQDLTNATEVVLDPQTKGARAGRAASPSPAIAGGSRSAGRAAAGAVRISNTIGAAFTSRRVLEPVEGRPMIIVSLALLGLAVVFVFFPVPRVLAYPLIKFLVWISVALLKKGFALYLERRKHGPYQSSVAEVPSVAHYSFLFTLSSAAKLHVRDSSENARANSELRDRYVAHPNTAWAVQNPERFWASHSRTRSQENTMRLVRYLSLAFVLVLALSAFSSAEVVISVSFAPPPLPVYEQPVCPGEGYIWIPGYWDYDSDFDDYYWVPGTWVLAPEPGLLWTPPYWAWNGADFVFYNGYWGPQVGFYGGIVYGFGYFGVGYQGGYWQGNTFYYNRAVNNVNVTVVHNIYNRTVVNNVTNATRVSYNGGEGGTTSRPTPQEEAAARERHIAPTSGQMQQRQSARSDPQFRASDNHGKPPIAATPRPGEFHAHGVVKAKAAGGPYHHPASRGARGVPRGAQPPSSGRATHPNELPPLQRPPAGPAGNSKAEQKYQKEQQKLYEKQETERQKLEQKQEQDHRKLARRNANEAQKQQLEQRHQEETQQLHQRHQAEQQRLEQRQSKPPR